MNIRTDRCVRDVLAHFWSMMMLIEHARARPPRGLDRPPCLVIRSTGRTGKRKTIDISGRTQRTYEVYGGGGAGDPIQFTTPLDNTYTLRGSALRGLSWEQTRRHTGFSLPAHHSTENQRNANSMLKHMKSKHLKKNEQQQKQRDMYNPRLKTSRRRRLDVYAAP
ncbi:hypothetical protein MRX96_046030 [Rhipicephalus microplus]